MVVDETACLTNAADSIVKGAAYDNNLLCIGEKQVFCVESVFDKLMAQMEKHGGFLLNAQQIEALTKAAFKLDPKDGKPHVNKDFVGQGPERAGRSGRRSRFRRRRRFSSAKRTAIMSSCRKSR